MTVTTENVLTALRTVQDPELFKDIVTLNMVKDIKLCNGVVSIQVELTTPACPLRGRIRGDIEAAVRRLDGVQAVEVTFSARVRGMGGTKNLLPGVKNVIAVGAGKGGVGKSTLAVKIAAGLSLQGAKVGLMDGDVYGPSIPTMIGLPAVAPNLEGETILPFLVGAAENPLRVMSIGFIVPKDKALIWRGPMVHGVIRQFLEQVRWGELDYLVVDLPPGTGDVSLTLAQLIPLTGAVIVATPQEVALADARRAVQMFQQLGVAVLGVVENMSCFVCEHGVTYDIFGRGGAEQMACAMGLPFLGDLPIDLRIRRACDAGEPFAELTGEGPSAAKLTRIVQALAGQISIRNLAQPAGKAVRLEVTE